MHLMLLNMMTVYVVLSTINCCCHELIDLVFELPEKCCVYILYANQISLNLVLYLFNEKSVANSTG